MSRRDEPGKFSGQFLHLVFALFGGLFALSYIGAPIKTLLDLLGPGFRTFLAYLAFAGLTVFCILILLGPFFPNDKSSDKR